MWKNGGWRRCGVWLVMANLVSAIGYAQTVNESAIARVRSGQVTEARASWWGFEQEDSTDALQAALNSGARRVIVDQVGAPWIVRPLSIPSNLDIVFERGVVVEAKRGAFRGTNDCLLRVSAQHDVRLIGDGAILRMQRADYDKPPYKKAEWRHVLSICSSTRVEVSGLTLTESGGDGIYLGTATKGVTNKDIHIRNVKCLRNYRQGISVITAENLLIEDTILNDTDGTAPRAGIDFEPNSARECLVNCVLRNCVADNNTGVGYAFYLPNLTRQSAPISIRMENCTARGTNRTAFALTLGRGSSEDAAHGKIEIVNCTLADGRGPAVVLRNKPIGDCAIHFRNSTFKLPAGGDPKVPVILLQADAQQRRDTGDIHFDQCHIVAAKTQPVMQFVDRSGETGLDQITGTVLVERASEGPRINAEQLNITQQWLEANRIGKRYERFEPYPLDARTVKAVRPICRATPIAVPPFALRHGGTYGVLSGARERVQVVLRQLQVGNYAAKDASVECIGPDGKVRKLGTIPLRESKHFAFVADTAGLYRVQVDCGAHRVQLAATTHPTTLVDEGHGIHFISSTGDLYFHVPASVQRFGVKIMGEGQEAVKAAIVNPAGVVVWERAQITEPEQYVASLPPGHADGVWKLRLSRPSQLPMEDFRVWLQGIPPLLATQPDWLPDSTAVER